MKKKNKILVVDDKGINRYMLGGIFGEEYEIVEASGGQMAIDISPCAYSKAFRTLPALMAFPKASKSGSPKNSAKNFLYAS